MKDTLEDLTELVQIAREDGLRVGALGWLMAHGSGVRVAGFLRATSIAASIAAAARMSASFLWRLPIQSSIIAADRIIAVGLALP